MIPLPIIAALVAGAIGAAGAWNFQAARYGEQIATMQRDQALAANKQLEQAHAQTIALQAKADTAAKQHATRASKMANDVAGVRSALVSLSDAADGALRAANDSHGACMANASTLRVVFGECTQRRNEVAANAQGHLIDKQALTEAWPVQSKP